MMNKRGLYKLIFLLTLILIMAMSLVFVGKERKKVKCAGFTVVYDYENHFVPKAEIARVIKREIPNLVGCNLDDLQTESIEKELKKNVWIKSAEVFKGYQYGDSLFYHGILKVKIKQRVPVFRVIDGSFSYYVDAEGTILPHSKSGTANVLTVTGHVTREVIDEELLGLVEFINSDSFWKAQIQQIHVQSDGDLLLVPRVGSHKIIFGEAVDIEKKFRNLKAVYEKGFSHGGWDEYKYVSLKYNNLVVCAQK